MSDPLEYYAPVFAVAREHGLAAEELLPAVQLLADGAYYIDGLEALPPGPEWNVVLHVLKMCYRRHHPVF